MFSSLLCVSSRSHGLHGTWQRAGRDSSSEKNGPAKPCEGWPDPQTGRLEAETPTATSLPQGAHAVLEQGGFCFLFCSFKQPEVKKTNKMLYQTPSSCCTLPSRPTLCQFESVAIVQRTQGKALTNISNHKCRLVSGEEKEFIKDDDY